jgi:hypothetical protein
VVTELFWDASRVAFWMVVMRDITAISKSSGVLRGILRLMEFSIIWLNCFYFILVVEFVWLYFVIFEMLFRLSIIGVWSEERSRELVIEYLI